MFESTERLNNFLILEIWNTVEIDVSLLCNKK